jgi:hypothetical protein
MAFDIDTTVSTAVIISRKKIISKSQPSSITRLRITVFQSILYNTVYKNRCLEATMFAFSVERRKESRCCIYFEKLKKNKREKKRREKKEVFARYCTLLEPLLPESA